jgi:hypothetical protein
MSTPVDLKNTQLLDRIMTRGDNAELLAELWQKLRKNGLPIKKAYKLAERFRRISRKLDLVDTDFIDKNTMYRILCERYWTAKEHILTLLTKH